MRIDVHAHLLPADLPDWRARTGDARWPALVGNRLELAGRPARTVDDGYWSVERRSEVLAGLGIDVQVLSPLPALLPWWAGGGEAREWCRIVNEATAAAVAAGRGRFLGLGIVPLQDPGLAAAELDSIRDLGLVGVEVGPAVDADRSLAHPGVARIPAGWTDAGRPVPLPQDPPH